MSLPQLYFFETCNLEEIIVNNLNQAIQTKISIIQTQLLEFFGKKISKYLAFVSQRTVQSQTSTLLQIYRSQRYILAAWRNTNQALDRIS